MEEKSSSETLGTSCQKLDGVTPQKTVPHIFLISNFRRVLNVVIFFFWVIPRRLNCLPTYIVYEDGTFYTRSLKYLVTHLNSCILYALTMFSISLRITKTDRNMSEL